MTTELPPRFETVCYCGTPLSIRVTLERATKDGRTVFEVHLDHKALAEHNATHEDI